MNNKALSIVMTSILLVSLSGCGSNETKTVQAKVTEQQTTQKTQAETTTVCKDEEIEIESTTVQNETITKEVTKTLSTTQATNTSKEKSVADTTTTTKAPQTTTTTKAVAKNERDYGFANSLGAQFNVYRASVGLNQLSQSGEMQEMAMRVAERIVDDFNHTPGDHSACNVSTAHARGEVIQYTSSNSPNDALQSFKNSSSHNATLLSDGGVRPLTGYGVGVVHAANGLYYICILTYTDNSYYG